MASISFYSNNYDGRQLRLTITQTQIINASQSILYWTLYSEGGNDKYYTIRPTQIAINGETVYSKELATFWDTYEFPAAKGSVSGNITVTHNNDGSLSVPVYFYTGVYSSKWEKDYGGTFTLDNSKKRANITAAPNFNDEENPTITYNNPAGNLVTSLKACISWTGADDIAYREIPKTGTSYTFNLTDAERAKLRSSIPNSNSRTVKFYVTTTIDGEIFYSTLDKTFSIVNANPTLTPAIVDSNTTTIALTGDSNKLIRYCSNATYTIGAAAIKGASLISQKVAHNNVTKTTATGTFNAIENANFVFSATDSRGYNTQKIITKTLVEYIKLTCNQNIKPTVGKVTINISGNYFNGNFGAVANTLTVQYRYKAQNSTYSDWIAAAVTKKGNTYTATASLSDLDYRTTYVFQSRAIDKINTSGINSEEKIIRVQPVFDWGANDFNINGDLKIHNVAVADYVVEQGTRGMWTYRKWNSGNAECWGSKTITVNVNEPWGPLFTSGGIAATNVTFPFTFVEVPTVNVNLSGTSSSGFIMVTGNISKPATTTETGIFEICRGAYGAGMNYKFNYSIKGKWK